MKNTEVARIHKELQAMQRGEIAPGRVYSIEKQPDGTITRIEQNPEAVRRGAARAWKANTKVAKIRHRLNLQQQAFAKMLGVSLNTLRKWERGATEPSGAARTLLILAENHPQEVQEAAAIAEASA